MGDSVGSAIAKILHAHPIHRFYLRVTLSNISPNLRSVTGANSKSAAAPNQTTQARKPQIQRSGTVLVYAWTQGTLTHPKAKLVRISILPGRSVMLSKAPGLH